MMVPDAKMPPFFFLKIRKAHSFFVIFWFMNTNKISEPRFPAAGYSEFTNLTPAAYKKVVP